MTGPYAMQFSPCHGHCPWPGVLLSLYNCPVTDTLKRSRTTSESTLPLSTLRNDTTLAQATPTLAAQPVAVFHPLSIVGGVHVTLTWLISLGIDCSENGSLIHRTTVEVVASTTNRFFRVECPKPATVPRILTPKD